MSSRNSKEVSDFMNALPKDKNALVEPLRAIIFDSIPGVEEVMKWKTLTYKRKGIIGMILVFKNQVNLQLLHGAQLKDEAGLLEGTGKGMRHVRIVMKRDIKKRALVSLLRQAALRD